MARPDSRQLHRARRQQELERRDLVLCQAEGALHLAAEALAYAQANTTSPQLVVLRIKQAETRIKAATTLLRQYYDERE